MSRSVYIPQTLEELWEVWSEHPEAAVYHGGTDLLVHIKNTRINPPELICIERIQEIKKIKDLGNELYIGAGLTHSDILSSEPVKRHWPILIHALAGLASPPIRNVGTLGGNLGTASPAGDSLPALYCLDAQVHLASAVGERNLPVQDFILGPGRTALSGQELIVGVQAPKKDEWNIHHFEKIGRRKGMACGLASLAALIRTSRDGRIEEARLSWGGVGPTVVWSGELNRLAVGKKLSLDEVEELASRAEKEASPIDDQRASAAYRKQLVGALLRRLAIYGDSAGPETESSSLTIKRT